MECIYCASANSGAFLCVGSSRDNLLSPVRPESCPLVQSLLLDRTGRVFLEHAQTQLKTGLQTQDRHLLLFTDTLLVAKTK